MALKENKYEKYNNTFIFKKLGRSFEGYFKRQYEVEYQPLYKRIIVSGFKLPEYPNSEVILASWYMSTNKASLNNQFIKNKKQKTLVKKLLISSIKKFKEDTKYKYKTIKFGIGW